MKQNSKYTLKDIKIFVTYEASILQNWKVLVLYPCQTQRYIQICIQVVSNFIFWFSKRKLQDTARIQHKMAIYNSSYFRYGFDTAWATFWIFIFYNFFCFNFRVFKINKKVPNKNKMQLISSSQNINKNTTYPSLFSKHETPIRQFWTFF